MNQWRHFYHVFAGGAWAQPVREHAAALRAAKLEMPMTVGIVGAEERDRYMVRTVMAEELPGYDLSWIEAEAGYEEVTLGPLYDWCLSQPRGLVLYAHDKGARDDTTWNLVWRRSMTYHMVHRWEECVEHLGNGCDTVGCHWLHLSGRPGPIYAGNFWWARADYICRLRRLKLYDRMDAEDWLGSGPVAYDMLPGFPEQSLCLPSARKAAAEGQLGDA